MIYVLDDRLKVDGVYFPLVILNTQVSESGKIEDKKKGKKTLRNQPIGWEAATVEYEVLFEDNPKYDLKNSIMFVQNHFKKPGQSKQKKVKLVDPYVNARGVTEVYFNEFVTSSAESESKITGKLSFFVPAIADTKVGLTKKQQAKKKAAAKKAAAKKAAAAKKKKTKKNTKASPAKKKTSTAKKKAAAKKVVKKK